MKSLIVWIVAERSSACGGSDFLRNVWRGWKKASARDGPGLFPPEVVVQVKALACELPSSRQQPLSRWSVAEMLHKRVDPAWSLPLVTARYGAGLTGCHRSGNTLLDLSTRSDFAAKAGRILDSIIASGRASR